LQCLIEDIDGGDPPSVGDPRIVPRGLGHHLVKWETGGYYQGSTKVQPPIPPVPIDEFRQIVEAGANILTAIHSL